MRGNHAVYRKTRELDKTDDEHAAKKRKTELGVAEDVLSLAMQKIVEKNGGKDRTPTKQHAVEQKWHERPSEDDLENSMHMLKSDFTEEKSKPLWKVMFLIYKRAFENLSFIPSGLNKELDATFKGHAESAQWFYTPTGKPPQHITPEKVEEFVCEATAGLGGFFSEEKMADHGSRLVPYVWLKHEIFHMGASAEVQRRFELEGEGRALAKMSVFDQWFRVVQLRNGILKDLWNIVMFCCDAKGEFDEDYLPEKEEEESESEKEEDSENDDEEKEPKKEKVQYTKCPFCKAMRFWEGCCTKCQRGDIFANMSPEGIRMYNMMQAMDQAKATGMM